MTNSGALISSIPFPPRDLVGRRSPGDVLTIGFTSRCVLTVVLRDSLVLCYDLAGDPALPPFYALPGPRGGSRGVGGQGGSVGGSAGGGTDLLEARTYGGGVAVLGADHNAAIVELLDEFDGPAYPEGADASARRIAASSAATQPSSSSSGDPARSPRVSSAGGGPSRYALITPLPTGAFARARHLTYRCLAVLPREHAPSRRPELFLSTSDGSVVVAEAHPSTSPDAGATDVDCRGRMGGSGSVEGMGRPRPVASMSFAPNGRFLACWTSDGWLTVVSSDFTNKVLEFDARGGCPGPPRSMGWCGEDSVALHWKEAGVLLVGPYGHQLPFSYRERGANGGGYGGDRGGGDGGRGAEVYLVPEIDCCRVATSHSVEILQRVPPVAADLLRIGSIEPGALLLDASDAFDAGSPNADEAARAITRQEGLLEEAIAQCVEAAAGEFDVRAQKRMLRAASYGLHFACRDEVARRDGGGGGGGGGDGRGVVAPGRPSPEAAAFVATARKLRVLNALRSPGIGFATTSSQYDSMGPRGVAARLIAAGRPSLAASVAGYLKLGRRVVDRARATKAAAFVSSRSAKAAGMTDAQMAQEAMRLLRGEEEGGGSPSTQPPPSAGAYASVALAAHRAGRKGVADVLVRQEESPDDRVRALLGVGSYAEAAAAACRARDPDLVQEALSAYEGSFSDNEEGKNLYFAGVANKFPAEAVNMLTAYHSRMGAIEGGDARPAMNVLLRRQKHLEAGLWRAKRAVARPSMTTSSTGEGDGEKEKVEALKEASKIFDLGGKDCAFQKSCTDEQVALLAEQEQLRRTYGAREVAPPSSSVTATIASVLKYGAVDPRAAFRLGADADRIAKKYKVPEKRMWHVKVRALAESGQWPLLRNFADTRARPPIGIKPFALAAIRGGRGHVEVEHYAKRMTDKSDGEDRYEVFCEAGMWKRALEEAANLGDGRKIAHVRSMCNSPDVQRLCDRYI